MSEARAAVTRYVTGLLGADPAARAADLRRVLAGTLPAALDLLAEVLIDRLAAPAAGTRAAARDALALLGSAALGPLTSTVRTDHRVRVIEGVTAVLAAIGSRLTEDQRADLVAALAVPALTAKSAGVRRALAADIAALRDHP